MRRRKTTSPPTPPRVESRGEALPRSARTMLAAATHEIRGPMHTILGMSELLSRTTMTPAQQQYLDALRRAAQTLTELLDNVLDAQRTAQPADQPRRDRLWLPEVVEGAIAMVRTRAEQAGLALTVHVDADVPRRLLGDRVRLQQVLANLLSNAVKYTPRGSVALRIQRASTSTSSSGPEGSSGGLSGPQGIAGGIADGEVRLAFIVEDTGPGIAADRLPGLFEPWARQPEHSHLEGVGLGLHITRQLVVAMGGTLGVQSSTGEDGASPGTTFRVDLPVGIGESPSDSNASVAIRGIGFLVVGSKHFGEVVQRALSPWSPRLVVATSTTEALEIREDARRAGNPFHALIVDNEAFDGVKELAAEIPLLVAVPQVALLRLGNEVERVAATPILLPVTTANLYAAITRAFRATRGSEERPERPLEGAVIFAADDDPDARVLLTAFLEDTGARVSVFASVGELSAALQVARSDSGGERPLPLPSVILCDVEMPDGGVRALRSAWPDLTIPIIPVTAHGDEEARALQALGFAEVGRKPLTREALAALVERHLRPNTQGETPRAPTTTSTTTSTKTPSGSSASGEAANKDMHELQLEARMALARRDYRGLTLLARRLGSTTRGRLETAAKAKDDAAIREILKDLDAPATIMTTDDALRALLPAYLERRARDVQDVADALAAQRFDDISFLGHRLRGTARTYGMPGLGEVGEQLEAAGKARDGAAISLALSRMQEILRAANHHRDRVEDR